MLNSSKHTLKVALDAKEEIMTAAEARREYQKPYILEEILQHIESQATESLRVRGYNDVVITWIQP